MGVAPSDSVRSLRFASAAIASAWRRDASSDASAGEGTLAGASGDAAVRGETLALIADAGLWLCSGVRVSIQTRSACRPALPPPAPEQLPYICTSDSPVRWPTPSAQVRNVSTTVDNLHSCMFMPTCVARPDIIKMEEKSELPPNSLSSLR